MNNKSTPPDSNEDEFNDSIQRFDELLKRGMDNVSRIDIDEFTQGLSPDDVGHLLSDNDTVNVSRSEFSTARKVGNLQFEENIQYIVSNNGLTSDEITIEDIESLASVTPGLKIASIKKDGNNGEYCNQILLEYDDIFQKEAGIFIRNTDLSINFFAAKPGKVVYLNDSIHILSADRDATCEVQITDDGLSATVDLTCNKGDGKPLTLSTILDKLESTGIIRGIQRVALEEIVNKVNTENISLKGITAATGSPPEHGKDGSLQLHAVLESANNSFKILPDGRIDYRKQASINMVNAGDHIATIKEPDAGVDGFTVTGEIIPAHNGEPVQVFEGDNIQKDSTGIKLFATAAGMLSFHDNILSVFPMYHVNSDVDLKCGNISFNGSVLIQGTVRAGFEVKAAGDIIILGSSESAHIEAGRDIRVNGAIIGGGNSITKAGRDIYAGHTQNARLEAQGDINIVRSIMHSIVYSTGKVVTHDMNSSIVGGAVHAMRGLEVMSIGSSLGTPTEIVGGSDYLIQRKINELKEIERFYKENIMKIDAILRPLMDIVKKGIPLGSEKKRRLSSIVEKRTTTFKHLQMVQFKINKMSAIDPTIDQCSIIIQKYLYQDVTLRIGSAILLTKQNLRELKCNLSSDKKTIETRSIKNISF